MKIGDKIPVQIAGQQVALATVRAMEDGTATLEFPATRAVMAVRTELAPDSPRPASEVETIITGVEREGQTVESAAGPAGETVEAPQAVITTSGVPGAVPPGQVPVPAPVTPAEPEAPVEQNDPSE